MGDMSRRILAFILVLVMVLGMLPTVFAVQEEQARSVTIDFAEFVQEACKQDFWDDFAVANTKKGNEVTRIGAAYQKKIADAEKETYQELLTWMDEQYSWSINEEKSGFMGGDGSGQSEDPVRRTDEVLRIC